MSAVRRELAPGHQERTGGTSTPLGANGRGSALALLALLWLGCTEGALKAEEPVWGKQQCAHCAMLVSEKPPAAQAVTADGKRRFFDDVGCLVAWEDREAPKVTARWVRAPGNAGWADPSATRFSPGHPTPMDFGFLPDAQGTVSFDELRAAVREKARHPAGSPP